MSQESKQPRSHPSRLESGESRPRSGGHTRRRRKRMNPVLYILLVVASSALLAGLGWMWAGDVLALNKQPATAVITVENGDSLNDVASALKENGLIDYKPLFKLFCSVTGVEKKEKITPGTYELNTDMDYNALVNAMSSRSGSRMTASVTIPEGYTLDQIFHLLDDKGVATVDQLQSVAASHDFNYSFLKGVLPLGNYHRLEGYLFPDTYEFYMGGGEDEVVQILNKMILRFDQQFTDELRQKAADMGYSVHEMVTIASLIEKETDGTDQARIASVIYNRLNNPGYETVGLLQIDAAIAYVTGRPVTQSDYQSVDSPYNTYRNKGLPPGPIASPGMTSLNAALKPESTKYYYYVVGDDHLHHFFRTSAEFEAYKATLGNRNG
ncbi:MAG: endolytic transglycosylase MltG [Oscillospiraceae bacterium]|jgi:UPF0755 protein